MGEPKTFASLSSGLLARKGAARPAMRPQGFGQVGAGLDDLGWNDMGFEAPKPSLSPVRDSDHDAFGEEVAAPVRNPLAALTPASPVHSQQAEIEQRFSENDEEGENEDGEYIDETAELYEPEEAPVPTFAPRKEFALPPISQQDDEPEAEADHWVDAATAETFTPAEAVADESSVADIAYTPPVAAIVVDEPAPLPIVKPVARARRPRAAAGSKGKAAFTLRLDPARHLKLRLACAVSGRSAQQIVTDALDQLLAAMPELESMADRVPPAARD